MAGLVACTPGVVDPPDAGGSLGTAASFGEESTGDDAADGNVSGTSGADPTGAGPTGDASTDTGPGDAESSGGDTPPADADCVALVTDPSVGWRDGTLATDQEIVECLWSTLGRPVGHGENANGGYDPDGGSQLVIIDADAALSVEDQILAAIAGEEHAWIVFDKDDFADPYEIGLYRAFCDDAEVLAAIDGTSEECEDYTQWCEARNIDAGDACLDAFFNVALNDAELPIRNPVIGSNKTIDGRMSAAYFLFSGFAIGRDSTGEPVETATGVILTHLDFVGAGHVEDHYLDPDMIRSTGASHDIWIHKNTFDTTGDSAFDVKVGAYGITMSFNRVVDVLRATLHGSSDSHVIDVQIATTMHHNAFVTRDDSYLTLGNTGRRVPLIRHGQSHIWNNLFVNYRKDVLSLRVGASVFHEDNAFVVSESLMEKPTVEASLEELQTNLVRDIDEGNYRSEGNYLWFSDGACVIDDGTQTELSAASGRVDDPSYGADSQATISDVQRAAGQDLIDYVSATAGKYGVAPFNSPLADTIDEVLAAQRVACQ
jgi:pectate lyase